MRAEAKLPHANEILPLPHRPISLLNATLVPHPGLWTSRLMEGGFNYWAHQEGAEHVSTHFIACASARGLGAVFPVEKVMAMSGCLPGSDRNALVQRFQDPCQSAETSSAEETLDAG